MLRNFNLRFRVENATFHVQVFPHQQGILLDDSLRASYRVINKNKVEFIDRETIAAWCETEMNNGDGFDAVRVLETMLTGHLFCPDCGTAASSEKFEDNGCATTSYEYTLLCMACKHQWSPNAG